MLLLLAVGLPAAIYVLLSLEPVQNTVRDTAASELSKLLGADVTISNVQFHPFNRLSVRDIRLDIDGETAAEISTVSAGFELFRFIRTRDIVIDYALIDGLNLRISRDSVGAPLNIQPVLDRLSSGEQREKKSFDLSINTVLIRNGIASYDILSAAEPDSGKFDPNHIHVSDLAINAYIPQISDRNYLINLDHLSLTERSGFTLKRLSLSVALEPQRACVSNLSLDLPNSHLAFEPICISYTDRHHINQAVDSATINFTTLGSNTLYPPDFASFVPILNDFSRPLALSVSAKKRGRDIVLNQFRLTEGLVQAFDIALAGDVTNFTNIDSLSYRLDHSFIRIDGPEANLLGGRHIPSNIASRLRRTPSMLFNINASGTPKTGNIELTSTGSLGNIDIDADYIRRGWNTNTKAIVTLEDVDLRVIAANDKFGLVDAKIEAELTFGRKINQATATADISHFDFNNYPYSGIYLSLEMPEATQAELKIESTDPAAGLMAYAIYDETAGKPSLSATATLSHIDLFQLGFDKKRSGYSFDAKVNAILRDLNAKAIDGRIEIYDLNWANQEGKSLKMNRFIAEASPNVDVPQIDIHSDYLDGTLKGHYWFPSIAGELQDIFARFMPVISPDINKPGTSRKNPGPQEYNDFIFDITLHPCQQVSDFLGLPVAIIVDTDITGRVDSRSGYTSLDIDIPYLRNGDKLIENSKVFASMDLASDKASVYATTQFPTKKGDMILASLITAANNRVDTHVDWDILRQIPINGTFDFSATLKETQARKGDTFPVVANVEFKPGTINFGDETWRIEASSVDMDYSRVTIEDFALDTGKQRIAIDGAISSLENDSLSIDLRSVSLLPIFETLEIDKALISGRATGTFTAKDLLTKAPYLNCPKLTVDSIGYNHCPIGNANIQAGWDNDKRAFALDAAITGFEGKHSHIFGDIYPFDEALDINFEADSVPVGFLKPFMEAFANDISGRATGKCRLFGTFKEIDLEGDIYADRVKIGIDFTGCSYYATDSVHLEPGRIELHDVTITDTEGHTAKLNGHVGHTFFKQPTFKFDITDAHDFLSYNITSRQNPDWYGTIYGNGGASVTGWPGVVNINVDMATAPRSTFTFVLSDRLDAEDYSFLTFRDVTPDSLRVQVTDPDDTPEIIKALKSGLAAATEDAPSQYNMDIRVEISRDAAITLVMDPAGGDEIKAHGNGNLHMAYHSDNNDLNIWGKYVLSSGSYRFTLQDIIIKDFTIKEGSSIQFDGDPYAVKTNLSAYYATNANLSDLDESFLQDKEVARTNVPVHAIMNVSGDIRQPSIDFDLEFPTLTSDTYRKVRSIVSTADMMNRQIIYLLALNRFYTPDYMASTTKGSELFSVASSTISSQLGNMLGKLSENWSIAPNLRSDRGDFSDVEVDVTLSSRLLNNRLIFNGNFGYRDKALNSNQFIGDFDIDYLLNKSGTWRLKAYNRYNDRNYYVRSAQTTQGIGIVYRRDFDNLFNFLLPKKSKAKKSISAPADSIPNDSITSDTILWNPSDNSSK